MNNKNGMSPERLERICNYARWLIENTGKGQRRGLAEAYLALEADLKRATYCHNDTLDEVRRLDARCTALEKVLTRRHIGRAAIRRSMLIWSLSSETAVIKRAPLSRRELA